MGFFNFNNLLNMASQFSAFKQNLQRSGDDPRKLLEAELKRRNVSPAQLQELIKMAQLFSNIAGRQ